MALIFRNFILRQRRSNVFSPVGQIVRPDKIGNVSRNGLLHRYYPMEIVRKAIKSAFLPRDYPKSVHPNYLPFCTGHFIFTGCSTVSSILATQSLLQALGVVSGANVGEAAVSATIAWILKDGLGQLGGVLYASRANTHFDSCPRAVRFQSILLLQLGSVLEWTTVLVGPAFFLPLAATSNVFKNIACLGLSATRAQAHRTFSLRDNLGDVTGKGGSQGTAASLIGTGVGVFLVSQLSGVVGPAAAIAFFGVNALGIIAGHQSCRYIVATSLNEERCQIVFRAKVKNPASLPLSPEQVSKMESVFFGWKFFQKFYLKDRTELPVILGASIEKVLSPRQSDESLEEIFSEGSSNQMYYVFRDKSEAVYLWYDDRLLEELPESEKRTQVLIKGYLHAILLSEYQESDHEIMSLLDSIFDDLLAKRELVNSGWRLSEVFLIPDHSCYVNFQQIK